MIILRSNLYSSKKDNLDNPTKAYLAGSVGFLGAGGYKLKTATKNSFKKKLIKGVLPREEIGKILDAQLLHQPVASEEELLEKYAKKYLELTERNRRVVKKAKQSIINGRIAGRALLATGVGLGTAAGYRYYKNKQKNDN